MLKAPGKAYVSLFTFIVQVQQQYFHEEHNFSGVIAFLGINQFQRSLFFKKKASQKIDLKYRFISQHTGNGKSMNPFVFSQGSTSNAAFAQIAKILKIALSKDASERINLKAGQISTGEASLVTRRMDRVSEADFDVSTQATQRRETSGVGVLLSYSTFNSSTWEYF